MSRERIIFFDGLCPMCHSWVKRIIRWDKKKIYRFAPLEGEKAKEILSGSFPNYLKEDTIIFYDEGKIYTRSAAALQIVKHLRIPYVLLFAGMVAPRFIRDGVYRWVANRRYTYGKRFDSCPLPPVEWRGRFLG